MLRYDGEVRQICRITEQSTKGAGVNTWEQTSAKLGGISRTLVFQLWASGALASVKIGRRRFSTDAQISEYISRLEGAA